MIAASLQQNIYYISWVWESLLGFGVAFRVLSVEGCLKWYRLKRYGNWNLTLSAHESAFLFKNPNVENLRRKRSLSSTFSTISSAFSRFSSASVRSLLRSPPTVASPLRQADAQLDAGPPDVKRACSRKSACEVVTAVFTAGRHTTYVR